MIDFVDSRIVQHLIDTHPTAPFRTDLERIRPSRHRHGDHVSHIQMVFVAALLSPMLGGRLLGIPLAYQLQFEIGIRNLELIGQVGRQLSIIDCHVFRNVLHGF